MITYPIHEVFFAFQGEGVHSGTAAFFVRTYGCPVHCPFCDSAGTWHPSWVPKHVTRLGPAELALQAAESGAPFVVLTGGEPTMFDCNPLTTACHNVGTGIHLETSGAFRIQGRFDWITLSPKRWKLPLESSVKFANEFKLIIECEEDIQFYLSNLAALGITETDNRPIFLHPEWSKRNEVSVLNAITHAVLSSKGRLRAGYQIHKLYKCDQLDTRSAPLVPLGGDVAKGY